MTAKSIIIRTESDIVGQGRFWLVDSDLSWIDEQIGAPPLHLSEVQVHFENQGERYRIGILAQYLDDRQNGLRLVGDCAASPTGRWTRAASSTSNGRTMSWIRFSRGGSPGACSWGATRWPSRAGTGPRGLTVRPGSRHPCCAWIEWKGSCVGDESTRVGGSKQRTWR